MGINELSHILFSRNQSGNDDHQMQCVWIALGGNLGDVAQTLREARNEIAALAFTRLTASSRLYCTPPIGPAGQPDYLNAVIAIETFLAPLALLDALQAIELNHGRVRKEHWGARTLDLDIVAIDACTIERERLTLPHPHMADRQFVLRPLCDIAPQWQHPHTGITAAEMLKKLLNTGETPLAEGEAW